jgi:hypothetical protein
MRRCPPKEFAGFLAMFLIVFITTGVGNRSTYRAKSMPPMRATTTKPDERRLGGRAKRGRQGRREAVSWT